MIHRGLCGLALYALALAARACPAPGDTLFADDFQRHSGVVRYVATNGTDAGSGTAAAPWRHLQYAADHAAAGDTLCARGGVYNELLAPTHYGSDAAGDVVFENYPGETPIVDGTGLGVPDGQHGLITLREPSFVTVRGFELRNYVTASTSLVPIGLYVTGAGTQIRLLRNHIHDIRNTGSGCAANAFGLKVDGTHAPASINELTIANNEIDHLVLGCSESFSLDGNVEHWTIAGNLVHDTNNIAIGAIGYEQVAPDPAYDRARDGVIVGNTVYNISSFGNPAYGNAYAADGIYIDGGTRIVIERNLVHHVDYGIELASEHSTRVTDYVIARSNLVHSNNVSGVSLGGYANGVGGTDHCSVVNNTLFHNDTTGSGSGEVQIQYHATNNTIANNLIVAGAQGVMLYAYVAGTPAALDYNLYFSSAGAASTWTWSGTERTGYGAFRTASGQEPHGQFADPQIVDAATPDLHVAATSPARNAGTDLGVAVVGTHALDGAVRIQGAGIDLGAYEQP